MKVTNNEIKTTKDGDDTSNEIEIIEDNNKLNKENEVTNEIYNEDKNHKIRNNKNENNKDDKENSYDENSKGNKNSKTITKRNMTEIQMLNKDQKFSITDEAQNLYPKINLSQLLAVSPSIRKELEQGLKPRVERIICSLAHTNIPIIIGESHNISLKVLFDTGANTKK
ncbi:hypothetical protein BCR32DRAFT_251448 [Anaeromyces robustus]|uniref:Uncharacterized protein n=1 Tax=Anaeromyces robustus TaxID=1754192 RepID=A0A1Y1VR23_9FUNG|nr:hypothetical protein BCR32DRAFT_251448 [Anaeromyces robustus]|eukprot:ORX63738.1 hypothetical protein BCR32DRAFT_251448 [Anaeromyces robustus]